MQPILKELRPTLALALPIMLGMVAHMLVELTDCWMLGHYTTLDLASASLGARFVILILYVGIGFGQAVSALASGALGRGNPARAQALYRMGAWSTFAFAGVCFVGALFILPVYDHLGQPEIVAGYAKPYSILLAASCIPALFFQTLRNYYESLNRPWTPFLFLAAMVGLNVFFNWVFIFGNLGAPALGVVGAGYATLIARTALALVFWAWAHAKSQPLAQRARTTFPWDGLPEMVKIAATSGLAMVATSAAYIIGSLWMGTFGAQVISANRIVGIIDETLFMAPLGVAYALTVRLGHARGEGNFTKVENIYRGGIWLVAVFAGVVSVATVIWGRQLLGVFSPDPATIAVGFPFLIIASLFRIFDELSTLCVGALRGLVDVVIPAVIHIGTHWLVALPVAWWLCFNAGLGPTGVWWGYCAGIVLSGILLLWRTRHTIARLTQGGFPPNRRPLPAVEPTPQMGE